MTWFVSRSCRLYRLLFVFAEDVIEKSWGCFVSFVVEVSFFTKGWYSILLVLWPYDVLARTLLDLHRLLVRLVLLFEFEEYEAY